MTSAEAGDPRAPAPGQAAPLVDFEVEDGYEPEAPPTRPATTSIHADHHAGGVTLTVPAAGIIRGSRGLFWSSLLWSGLLALFTLGILPAFRQDASGCAVGAIALFWLVGIGMFVGALNMGLRSAVLSVVDGRLTIEQKGLLGMKRRQWARDELKMISTGPSGMEVNRVPILELRVLDRESRRFAVLAGRDEDELSWIAYELSRALGLEGW